MLIEYRKSLEYKLCFDASGMIIVLFEIEEYKIKILMVSFVKLSESLAP